MKDEIFNKSRLTLILVILTVILFIGMVWFIASNSEGILPGFPAPSDTVAATKIEKNCTYPAAYWVAHTELLPQQIVVGEKVYDGNEISQALSGNALDEQAQLQAQLIAAFLNVLSGADQGMIQTTIFQAYGWLVEHTPGIQLQDSEREAGTRLFTLLETYNLGLAGVTACQDAAFIVNMESSTPTETATVSPTIVFSQTPTATPTLTPTTTPSETATATIETIFPIWTAVVPTATLAPTTEPPGQPPPTVTQKPPPAPTDTPKPPTDEPVPTFTLPPQYTLPPPP